MQLTISRTQSEKVPYQDEAEEAIKEIPPQGWRVVDCEREFAEDPNRVVMTLKNDRNEEIAIKFLRGGVLAITKENIKQALMNHSSDLLKSR